MSRTLTAIVALVTAFVALASIAEAGQVAAKATDRDRPKGSTGFVLIPLTSGELDRDTGAFSACCWTQRFARRDGQAIEINNPKITLTSDDGTIVLRNRIEWVEVTSTYAVFTGTWKVVEWHGELRGAHGRWRCRRRRAARRVDQVPLAPKAWFRCPDSRRTAHLQPAVREELEQVGARQDRDGDAAAGDEHGLLRAGEVLEHAVDGLRRVDGGERWLHRD